MKLQKGKFLINNIDELVNIPEDKNGIKRIIDLEYMGQFEYEGNTIPISRMFIEYYKEDYYFYPTQIFNKDSNQMYIYANGNIADEKLLKWIINEFNLTKENGIEKVEIKADMSNHYLCYLDRER